MVKIKDFFNEDYISFAGYDNSRKISSVSDGLKTSQRKVLYTVLKNNIDSEQKEVKVEQLAAKTSEQTSYLHGATSLTGVTVGLATKYVGSNNCNLLEPDGNFGTRFIKEASAPRYIYTYLSDIAKYIIRKEDEPILEQQTFEGQVIEPKSYYPIIPLVLVNGAEGLSVGFASNIAPRDPKLIISWLEAKLSGKTTRKPLLPYYKGFKGTVEADPESPNKYIVKGCVAQDGLTRLVITEIPIKYTLKSYLKVLDTLCDKGIIKSYKDLSDNDQFYFEVSVKREFLEGKSNDDLLQTLKLTETITDNLVLLNAVGQIREYNDLSEILNEYYAIRYKAYESRKANLLKSLSNELLFYQYRKKFIEAILAKKIQIDRSIAEITQQLQANNFEMIDDSYDYLLNMKISSFSIDKVKQLTDKIENLTNQIELLNKTSIEEMWLKELKELQKAADIR